MESTNNPDLFRGEAPLDEPHFDEEATLLSARRVVPLHEVKAEERSGRRFVFGFLLVATLMIGVFGATLIHKQRADNRANAVVETVSPVSEPAQPETRLNIAGGASNADVVEAAPGPRESAVLVPEQDEDHIGRQESKNADTSSVRDRPSHTISGKPARSVGTNQTGGLEIDARDDEERAMRRAERRETRRLNRMEEREARHEAKRKMRADKARSDNDLLRIREIFEGPARP